MPTYQSYLNQYNNYMDSYTRNFSNPYSYSMGSPSASVVDNITKSLLYNPVKKDDEEEKRSFLNRIVDVLSTPNYMIAGAVDGAIRDDKTMWQGTWEGLKAGNPFGKGNVKGETTFSDVLGDMGWKPEGIGGKIGRGVTGFALDVALDPTTYLTGGLSALIKGSGKVGKAVESLGKLTEDITKATRYNTKIADLTSKGVNFDLAKRVAERGLGDSIDVVDTVDKLTPDLAENLIRFQNTRRGVSMSEAEIKDSATNFADKYNKLLGLRDTGKVTFGIGNLPFAPKSWRDKVVTLGSDSAIRDFSDITGISKAYAGLRNFIYGSQIGKMFSTTSPLFKLASKDPAGLYDVLNFVDMTKGMKLDKIQEEKMIRDRFKSMNLSPSEQKEVLDLLQDKTIWKPIKDKINLSQTDLAKHVRSLLTTRKAKNEAELNDLLGTKKATEQLKTMVDDNIAFNKEELDNLQSMYREQLARFDASGLQNANDYKSLIDELDKQIKDIDARTASHGDVDALQKLYENAKKQREAHNQFNERLNKLLDLKAKNARGELNNLIDSEIGSTRANESWIKMGGDEYSDPEEIARGIRQANNEAIDKEIFTMRGKSPGRSETLSLQDALSNYVYGETGKLVKLRDSNIDELMKLVEDGFTPDDIREHIKNYSERFAPHMSDVWNYIAESLNYSEWNKDGYKYPLGKLVGLSEKEVDKLDHKALERIADEFYKSGQMSPLQLKQFTDLKQKKMMRLEMINRFSRMTPEAFTRFRTEIANEKIIKDFYQTEDKHLSLERNDFNDAYFAGDPTVESSSFDDIYDLKDKDGKWQTYTKSYEQKPKSDGFIGLDSPQRLEAWNDMVRFNLLPNNFSDFASKSASNPFTKYINKTMGHLEDTLKHTFDKEYDELSDGAKKLALKTAMDLTLKNADRFDEKLAKVMQKKAFEVLKDEKLNAITRETTIGTELIFKKDGEVYRGIVEETGRNADDMTEYTVKVPTSGEIISGVKPSHVMRVKNDKKSMSPEDILRQSDMTKDDLANKTLLQQELHKAQSGFDSYKSTFKANRNTLMSLYDSRIARHMDDLRSLESKQMEYEKEIETFDPERIETLTNQIARDEERINNTDALEEYIKLHPDTFGNSDTYLKVQNADTGRIWLDEIASSDKVNRTVRELRHLFDKIGTEEIKIGRLSKEQFEGLLNQYVPHILTPDGEEHFANMRVLTEHGANVTHDLGYGIKYNPFSRHRTIKGKSIEEINEHFRDALKGQNLFSDNIADIYLARALKHSELMYDDKYMRTMLNVFGKDIPPTGKLEKGYKAVMNYGMLRNTISDVAKMNLSTHISEAVRSFIMTNSPEWNDFIKASGSDPTAFFDKQISQFLEENFDDNTVRDLFTRFHKKAISDSHLPSGVFDSDGFPMMEMSQKHIAGLNTTFNQAYRSHLNSLNRSLQSAHNRGDMKRIEELEARIEKAKSNYKPPQVKQVNDVIVQKANQARELQRAKDQRRFLQLYDKFLHFMKINQTTVVPSFHVRNKFSNMFLNWLGVGRDALNKDYQLASTLLTRHKGDLSQIEKLTSKSKFWENKFRPVTIDHPHPSLIEAVSLNNGQLHWTDLYELAKAHGVIDEGFFAQDIGASAMMKGKFKKLRYTTKSGKRINLDPTDTENFVLYRKGMEVGSTIENSDRLIHFLASLKQGKSIRESVDSTKQFLFDYSDLTAFEQSWMKRILPYYTWLRKNARLQVSQLIEQPNKYVTVAKIINGINHSTDREERLNNLGTISPYAQDWLQLPFTHINKDGNKEPIIGNPNMPFMDFDRLPDPTQPIDSLLKLASQTSPQLKIPAELALNRSFFFNDKIAKGDDKAKDVAEYLINQSALGNVGTGVANKEGIDLLLHAINSSTGVKMQAYDKDMAYAMAHQPDKASLEADNQARAQAIMRYLMNGAELANTRGSIPSSITQDDIANSDVDYLNYAYDEEMMNALRLRYLNGTLTKEERTQNKAYFDVLDKLYGK